MAKFFKVGAAWLAAFALVASLVLAAPPGSAFAVTAESGGDEPEVNGDVILITGSTGGLGREVARRLAGTGAHIIVHGRDHERGSALVREIEEQAIGSARFYAADLASLDEVRDLARRILADYDRLDVLINNAGVIPSRDERWETVDGYEWGFQVNYLSHFLLTHELLPLIVSSVPARIINVASRAQSPIDFDDVMLEAPGAHRRSYGQSKLAQILHAFDLADELEGSGVIVSVLHPASLMDTGMVRGAGMEPRSTIDEGADAVMQLVTEPIPSGQFFNGLNPARANAQAYDQVARAKLRELSRQLVGLGPG